MRDRPSLLFDARLVLEKPTGIGQYVVSLLRELIPLASDWTLHVVRRAAPWAGYEMDTWAAPHLEMHVSGLRHMSLLQHVAIPRLARRLGCDLIHYPHFDAPVAFPGVPVVATLHDAKYLVHPRFHEAHGHMKQKWARFCTRNTLHRAAAVITDSASTAQDMTRLFDIPQERFDVIPLAADSRYRPASPESRRRFRTRYRLERPYVLSVGELRPHKNHARLIRAWAQMSGPQTHDLVIVGQPHGDHDLPQRTVADLQLENSVHFLHDVGPEDMVAAYSDAEAFALVSLYEGFGLPILEAMACDVPVIASRTTSSGEVLGNAGISVDPENVNEISGALERLLTSEEERDRLRQRGRAHQAAFTWTRTAEHTLEVYLRALSGRATRA